MLHRRLRALVLIAALLLVAGACKDDAGGGRQARATDPPRPPLTYAAVGASETMGIGADKPATEAWPRVLADILREGGRQVSFTGLGTGGATVAEAMASSVPKAEALQPDLVTVWLNVNDIIREFRFPPTRPYEVQLGELVRRLRRGGSTTVLLANTPAVERLPAYLACLTPARTGCVWPAIFGAVPQPEVVVAKVAEYNRAIANVAQREGAVLVDLHAASLKAREEGRDVALVSSDGFHPSTAGHAAVAAKFAEAARDAGV